MRPERVAAAALVGIAVDVAVRLSVHQHRYIQVVALVGIAATIVAAREVRRGDVVGWAAAAAVATAVLSTVATRQVQDLPGLDGPGWSAGAAIAAGLAVVVLGSALAARRACGREGRAGHDGAL